MQVVCKTAHALDTDTCILLVLRHKQAQWNLRNKTTDIEAKGVTSEVLTLKQDSTSVLNFHHPISSLNLGVVLFLRWPLKQGSTVFYTEAVYLEVEDDGPHQPQDQLRVPIHDLISSDVHKLDLDRKGNTFTFFKHILLHQVRLINDIKKI